MLSHGETDLHIFHSSVGYTTSILKLRRLKWVCQYEFEQNVSMWCVSNLVRTSTSATSPPSDLFAYLPKCFTRSIFETLSGCSYKMCVCVCVWERERERERVCVSREAELLLLLSPGYENTATASTGRQLVWLILNPWKTDIILTLF